MSDANPEPSEDAAASAVNKRYEGLVALRTKAVKGKGAWYWAHFEPVLIRNSDTNLPKAVKLKCTLCDAAFSASNPSRTASEHLKRGTCPNFRLTLNPSSQQLPPLASPPSSRSIYRKRSTDSPTYFLPFERLGKCQREKDFATTMHRKEYILQVHHNHREHLRDG